jgi:ribonuclease HI
MTKTDSLIIHTDGASRGNPGPAAIGVTIKDQNGTLLAEISERLGKTTNNQAEYRAVIEGLRKALKMGAKRVTLYADSELVVRQLSGRYRVKNAGLLPLYQEAVRLIGSLESFKAINVPRGQNAEADALANKALDSQ